MSANQTSYLNIFAYLLGYSASKNEKTPDPQNLRWSHLNLLFETMYFLRNLRKLPRVQILD